MSIKKEYSINIDIKREFTDDSIYFRQNEGGEIVFNVFDDGKEMNISQATKAYITLRTPSKVSFNIECSFETVNNKRKIKVVIDEIKVIEVGGYKLTLTVQQGNKKVSTIPFGINVYSDMCGDGDSTYADLIGDLGSIFGNLLVDLADVIHESEKGAPNGVATLDENGLIPMSQLPDDLLEFNSHIQETVYANQVHGMRINNDGLLQYRNSDGMWIDAGYNIIRDGD